MSFTESLRTKPVPVEYQTHQPYPYITTNNSDSLASHDNNNNNNDKNDKNNNININDNPYFPHITPMTQHSGTSVATWFKSLFQVVIALSTLGASVTFNYILSDFQEPKFKWTKPRVHIFLSISWLLFLLALASASLASTLLNFFHDAAVRDWDGQDWARKRRMQRYATLTSFVLYALIVAAFVVMGLVVVAYSFVVGWVAVGVTAVFGVGGLFSILIQSPICSS